MCSRADFSSEVLRGEVPISVGGFSRLRVFDVGNNPIYGALPMTFWQIPTLNEVYLDQTAVRIRFPPGPINATLSHLCAWIVAVENHLIDVEFDA